MDKLKIHKTLCDETHKLYEDKNSDYGDSFSRLRKRYPNFVCMRLFDKLNRLDTIIQPGYECKVSDEKVEDTLMDIANYALMELTERIADRVNPMLTPKAPVSIAEGHEYSCNCKEATNIQFLNGRKD